MTVMTLEESGTLQFPLYVGHYQLEAQKIKKGGLRLANVKDVADLRLRGLGSAYKIDYPYMTDSEEKRLLERRLKSYASTEEGYVTSSGVAYLGGEVEKFKIDLIIQFGHSPWSYSRKDIRVLK